MSQRRDLATEEVTARAAEWFERHREGGLSAAERKSFSEWLSASPIHIREYLAVTEAWGGARTNTLWPEESAEQLIAAARASGAVTHLPGADRAIARVRRFKHPAAWWSAAAAASVLVVLGIVAADWVDLRWGSRDKLATARGEQKSIALEDGSVIQLNTMTRVRVRFVADRRVIELSEGEAFFRVAADPNRPFDVITPLGTVRAVGTEFNVYSRAGDMRVAVVEGKVQVAYANSRAEPTSDRKVVPLAAHQSMQINDHGSAGPEPEARSVEMATAWMQRRLAFENERLDVIVNEFNRYNRQQLRIADDALLELRINGIFNADDPGALTKYLQRLLDVDVAEEAGDTLVLRRRNKSVSVR